MLFKHARHLSTNHKSGYHRLPWEQGRFWGLGAKFSHQQLIRLLSWQLHTLKKKKFLLSPLPSPLSPFPPFHPTPLHSTPLHSAPLHSAPLHSTLLHSTPLCSTPLHSAPLHSAPLHSTPLRSAPLHSTPLHYRPFASSAEIRTRASCFGGGVPTTALPNGRCRG